MKLASLETGIVLLPNAEPLAGFFTAAGRSSSSTVMWME